MGLDTPEAEGELGTCRWGSSGEACGEGRDEQMERLGKRETEIQEAEGRDSTSVSAGGDFRAQEGRGEAKDSLVPRGESRHRHPPRRFLGPRASLNGELGPSRTGPGASKGRHPTLQTASRQHLPRTSAAAITAQDPLGPQLGC